jgi:hypothetical protein
VAVAAVHSSADLVEAVVLAVVALVVVLLHQVLVVHLLLDRALTVEPELPILTGAAAVVAPVVLV